MLHLIKRNDDAYKRYEDLLLSRDQYRKEAGSVLTAYLKEFGELLTRSFSMKIDCIRLKKEIAYCQARANRGEAIDEAALSAYIEQVMKEYEGQLDDMYAETESAKRSRASRPEAALEVKKLYRRLAKRLHPDINPMTEQSEELRELWGRIQIAYHANDQKELEELEVLTDAALADFDGAEIHADIPDIEGRIGALEEEIEKIRTTEPYAYIHILEDDELVEERRRELEAEIRDYETYREELEHVLAALLPGASGGHPWAS